MSDSSIDLIGTETVGTVDWLVASRDLTISAYIPGDLVDVPAPREARDGAMSESPSSTETAAPAPSSTL